MNTICRISTIAGCNAALDAMAASVNTLEYKKCKLERRLTIHHRIVTKAKEQLNALETELVVLNAGLSAGLEGRPARECRCKITKAQWRMQRLELRLEDYSDQALLLKELKLQQVIAALEATRCYIGQVQARRAQLLQAEPDDQPAITMEPVQQKPFISPLQPAPNLQHPAGSGMLTLLLKPLPGKQLLGVANGYG